MARIATTIEESKRLLELGIDPKSADMYYPNRIGWDNYGSYDPLPIEVKRGLPLLSQEIPAWSFGKLFDIAWELDPNQVLSFQKGEKMDLIAIMVDFIEMLVREVDTKGKEDKK